MFGRLYVIKWGINGPKALFCVLNDGRSTILRKIDYVWQAIRYKVGD